MNNGIADMKKSHINSGRFSGEILTGTCGFIKIVDDFV